MKSNKFTKKYFDEIRTKLKHGDNATQTQIDHIFEELRIMKDNLRPNEKDEIFYLVNKNGINNQLTAPRWLCHFLGLRHKSVHVLIKWKSPKLGNIFVLQVRSWEKSDSPGHLDISVGGHVSGVSENDSIETAYKEMNEELGINKVDLISGELIFKKGYENINIRENDNFYNTEWREVFLGEISTSGFEKIQFNDKEVVGIYLCPEIEAKKLLNQNYFPIASALEKSLAYCLK